MSELSAGPGAAGEQCLKDMGRTGEPIGAERLRQLMIEDGVDPLTLQPGIIEIARQARIAG